ncbi:MAG TPA: cyclic 2,3-diphosphoglycerate synthase [bacterium]|nr:cyclic 2,3-diphosphoglycerate synthase [bacterium]
MRKRVLIMGAAGRDFHDFNVHFRDNDDYDVVCFTATQIPNIEGRKYPPELAGKLYPQGIPIYAEDELETLIKEKNIDVVCFSYSDITHEHVMHCASRSMAAGADFMFLGAKSAMLKIGKPVVSICAVRTGAGKSQTTRRVSEILRKHGKKVAVIRHPMPYGDLAKQAVQRFGSLDDLVKHKCTIEEREEYEPHIRRGNVVFAGVDYARIAEAAEKEADIILWDGGNNDIPFLSPDLHIVVLDPHRAGHELKYHPGETNLRMACVLVINKVVTAEPEKIESVLETARTINPKATVIMAASPLTVDDPAAIRGKRVLCVEDGPTLTHGGMKYGAAVIAARRYGASEIVDPRPFCVDTIRATFEKYPGIGTLLPAMGYSDKQIKDLEDTINKTPCDVVLIGTPINLAGLIEIDKPSVRVGYELQEIGSPTLDDVLSEFLAKR